MKTEIQTVLAIVSATISIICSAQDITPCNQRPEIEAIAKSFNIRWESAVTEASVSRLAGVYAHGAILMPPTDETLVGNTTIADFWSREEVIANLADYSFDLMSCELRGEALIISGVWGTDFQTTGNLLRVLDRNDSGEWVSRYEIWN
ncbi:MAG: hypothetical protein AAF384_07320 [Pseudomonadota bacterium]